MASTFSFLHDKFNVFDAIIVFENRLKALKTRLLLLAANRRGTRIQTASDYFIFIII